MSFNVTGIRRSSPPYKALRSKAVGWNVGERKPHKAEGDCGFSNPEGANSARSVYRLLSEVFLSQNCKLPCAMDGTRQTIIFYFPNFVKKLY